TIFDCDWSSDVCSSDLAAVIGTRPYGDDRWPAKAIAFHPVLAIVAIGTGSYDGGYAYEGELLLLNLATGHVVSLLEWPREVRKEIGRASCREGGGVGRG